MSLLLDTNNSALRRILVVDDEMTLRLAYCCALQDACTQVDTEGDGCAALKCLGHNRYDLVILDLRMPGFDGSAVLDVLRDSGNGVSVILCTAAISPRLVHIAGRHGVVDFLLKPVLPSSLRQAVDFVVHPDRSPNADAWKAARSGDFKSAAQLLRQNALLSPREAAWLRIWDSSTEATGAVDESDILAINGPVGESGS